MTAAPLPGTDLAVSPIVLGGNMFGSRLDQDAAFTLLDAYAAAGGTMVDTAAVYADWLPDVERGCSEKTIGRWLRARPSTPVRVATKGGHPDLADPRGPRLGAAEVRQDVEQSLERLGVATLDLWLAHRDDPRRPVAEILGLFEDMRSSGLVRWYGVSNWPTERLEQAVRLRAAGSAPGLAATQVAFAAAAPRVGGLAPDLVAADDELLGLLQRSELALLAYSAAAKGWFGGADGARDAYDSEPNRQVRNVVRAVAREVGAGPSQVALAVLLGLDMPLRLVVGCSSRSRLEESVAAAGLRLTTDQQHRVESVLSAAPPTRSRPGSRP